MNYNLLTGQENEPRFLIVALIMVCLNRHWRVQCNCNHILLSLLLIRPPNQGKFLLQFLLLLWTEADRTQSAMLRISFPFY